MTLETFKIEVLPIKHKLYRLAKRLINNIPEAEDVVQEAFLRLWTKKDELKNYRSIEAFAMTITKNLCLDRMKSKSYKTDELTDKHEKMNESTPYALLELADSFEKIQLIIQSLPEQQRMIIHLRDIEEYELDEISEIMELNMNTVRVNLSRARKKVREMLTKTYNYEFAKN
jgi:RNA polymerase sigma-70 factor (ECF subfamily)